MQILILIVINLHISGKMENGDCAPNSDAGQLRTERDQLVEELKSMENSFGDLYRRYEKLRAGTEDLKTVSYVVICTKR